MLPCHRHIPRHLPEIRHHVAKSPILRHHQPLRRLRLLPSPPPLTPPPGLLPFARSSLRHPHRLDFSLIPPPRILGTTFPSLSSPTGQELKLPHRLLYREPKDTFVSMWHFLEAIRPETTTFENTYDEFCLGRSAYGPVWAHQLEHWRESVERPERVMFLKYEEVKVEPERWVRRLAKFLGKAFTEEEERSGEVGKIVELCSIEKLRNLDVNREGVRGKEMDWNVKNSSLFRKGEGDWREHLSLDMAGKLDSIMKEKLDGSGLNFWQVMMAQGI